MSKVRRSVTLSKEILEWINNEIKNKRFNNVSHAIEFAVYQLMKTEKPKATNATKSHEDNT